MPPYLKCSIAPLPEMLPAGTLEQLYARRRFGIRPGLGRVKELLGRLGNPERFLRCIHVVGTNGKGSTSAFLSSILSSAGFRTGLFTSPHLVSFTERLRINGEEINAQSLEQRLNAVLLQAPVETTFFEIVTALAALHFAEEGVDIAVMEAGMGGMSDATAALGAVLSIITPVSLDHCDYLGETVSAIAREKISIAEPGTPVISALQQADVSEVINAYCRTSGNLLLSAGHDFTASWSEDATLSYQSKTTCLHGLIPGIPGRYQSENAALAMSAAETLNTLGFNITANAIAAGITSARWPGRMESVSTTPRIILDGAHNPAGVAALTDALADFKYKRLLLVIGVMTDKNVRDMLTPLVPLVSHVYTAQPAVERSMDQFTLAGILAELGTPATPCGKVSDALSAAIASAGADDLILVCGSLFVAGEIKASFSDRPFEGIRG